MAIIGVSGKIGSGKDTVGKIIQYLTAGDVSSKCKDLIITGDSIKGHHDSKWQIRKFADKLKDIVCLLIGCTREQLEDSEFKNKPLGEEWTRYAYANGHLHIDGETTMWFKLCDKETYKEKYRINWQTAYRTELTPRLLLQIIGTNFFRNQLLENVWVNVTLADYKPISWNNDICEDIKDATPEATYPNIIITDVRFPNEVDAIKAKGGIIIRVESDYVYLNNSTTYVKRRHNTIDHESETALDDYQFDVRINNNHDIDGLISNVMNVLDHHNIEYNGTR